MQPEKILYPTLSTFRDDRGEIQIVVEGVSFTSVLRITSKKGAIRANHYHKEDYHYCVLESGRMEYYERPVGSTEKPRRLLIQPGQVFYTRAMVEHAMKFLDDSVFWCFSKLSRQQANYESDTVRVKLI
jgi:quercetin dioxygenase-like cupin family protein